MLAEVRNIARVGNDEAQALVADERMLCLCDIRVNNLLGFVDRLVKHIHKRVLLLLDL